MILLLVLLVRPLNLIKISPDTTSIDDFLSKYNGFPLTFIHMNGESDSSIIMADASMGSLVIHEFSDNARTSSSPNALATFPKGNALRNLLTSDFTETGYSDIVYLQENSSSLTLVPRNADGKFQKAVELQQSGTPEIVNLKDIFLVPHYLEVPNHGVLVTALPHESVAGKHVIWEIDVTSQLGEGKYEMRKWGGLPLECDGDFREIVMHSLKGSCVAEYIVVTDKSICAFSAEGVGHGQEGAQTVVPGLKISAPDQHVKDVAVQDVSGNGLADIVWVYEDKLVVWEGRRSADQHAKSGELWEGCQGGYLQYDNSKSKTYAFSNGDRYFSGKVSFSDVNLDGLLEVGVPLKNSVGRKIVSLLQLNGQKEFEEVLRVDQELVVGKGGNYEVERASFFDYRETGNPGLLVTLRDRGGDGKNLSNYIVVFEVGARRYSVKMTSLAASNKLDDNDKMWGVNQWRYWGYPTHRYLPGMTLQWNSLRSDKSEIRATHVFMGSTGAGRVHTPYLFVGIGDTVSYLQDYKFGIMQKSEKVFYKGKWGLPNAYFIVYPHEPKDCKLWIVGIKAPVSKNMLVVFFIVLIVLVMGGVLIVYLKLKEKNQDLIMDGVPLSVNMW